MKVSLQGLTTKIGEILNDPDVKKLYNYSGALDYTLQEMVGNMKEMERRKAEGEQVIDEFFNLYV